MEITYALFWFLSGAALMRALSTYLLQRQQRDTIVNIMANFLAVSKEFQNHLHLALEISTDHLKGTGMSEDEMEQHQKIQRQIIDKWGVICSTIVISGAPKSYLKYFEKTNFKDFTKL